MAANVSIRTPNRKSLGSPLHTTVTTPSTGMRPDKKPKATLTTSCRLAHEFMVHTQMCQSAIRDLKRVMKRSRNRQEISSFPDAVTRKLPTPTNTKSDTEPPLSDTHKESSELRNQSFKLQNGRHYHVEVDTTEARSILERLCHIGEQVDEFLRLSEGFIKHPKRKRSQSSAMDENRDHFLHQINEHLIGHAERPDCKQTSKTHEDKVGKHDDTLDKHPVELEPCASESRDNCKESSQQDKLSEDRREPGELIIDDMLERDDEKEASESEGDGFKELWREAEFYWECSLQEEREKQSESSAKEVCGHSFYLKADVGLVCEACGLIGKDIETIFNFTWGNGSRPQESKKRENNNAGTFEVPIRADSQPKMGNVLGQPTDDEQLQQSLILHSHYRAEMHEHQIEGFKFLEENVVHGGHGGCILAHAPGTGKTFLTIAFLHSFLQANPDRRVMILAPKGMLLPWHDITMMDSNPATQLKLNQLQRVKEWQMTNSILLVSYQHFSFLVNHQTGDALTMEVKRLILEIPGLLILDEGHISRNSDTVILKCLSDIRTKKRIMLSGTLFQNNFEEMYNLFKLVRPNFMLEKTERLKGFLKTLFDSQGDRMHAKLFDVKLSGKKLPEEVAEQRIFVNCLCEKTEIGTAEERKEALELIHELMAPFVHWHKGKVLEGLPGLTDLTIFLNLTTAQEAAFASLKKQTLNTMEREKCSALANVHPLLLSMRHPRRAVQRKEDFEANGEKLDQNADTIDGSSFKMMAECDPKDGCKVMFVLDVVALCHKREEKVLIFSQNLPSLTLLQKLFWKLWGWFDNQQVFRLDGEISSEIRERIINRFNKRQASRVLLASIKACGEGVSLVGASRVIFLDVNWNPAVTQQAISRAFRLGQTKRVYAYRLVGTGTLDEEIERAATRKEWLAAMISHASSSADFEAGFEVDNRELGFEVDPRTKDRLFESKELTRQVAKCYCKTQETISL
ncbi:hypothetical protein GOP47_0024854 [Adiantum capillus-veneris]|uniref:Uncharacterized protein n=1 Tax=Adiantum capillus-veneris TaxID=13818 RepID=A0A9D4U4S5_ADICA|nr:hypothetical protein GOP47_0024854 [Adiantum capillus-veneris]